jgi:solute carrier family 15 oligopeptide transporter 1
MDGNIGFMEIKPDQIQVINPFLILTFIPLYELAFYPLLSLIGIRRPLQKLALGGIFGGCAFILSGFVEMVLEPTYPVLPAEGHSQLRIFNGLPCDYNVKATDLEEINVGVLGMNHTNVYFDGVEKEFTFEFTSAISDSRCPRSHVETVKLTNGEANSFFISGFDDKMTVISYKDNIDKSKETNPAVRILANTRNPEHFFVLRNENGQRPYSEKFNASVRLDVPFGVYDLLVDDTTIKPSFRLRTGGVYTIIVSEIVGGCVSIFCYLWIFRLIGY